MTDVAPILQRRCVQCHTDDGPGRLPLLTYEQARTWARSIRDEVLERRMPPWPAASGFAEYANDRSLTPIEVELLTAWAEGGAPLGPVKKERAAPAAGQYSGRASLEFPLQTAGPPRGSVERVSIPTALTSDRWISGWSFHARNTAVVQRIVFSSGDGFFGSWVPGDDLTTYPRGVAQRLRAGATIAAEIQYTRGADAGLTDAALIVYPGAPGAVPQRRTLDCAANAITRDVEAIAIAPSAPAGESVEIVAHRPDTTVDPLSVVLQARPTYPVTYRFRKPVSLPRGTIVDVRSSAPNCSATLEFIARTPGRAVSR